MRKLLFVIVLLLAVQSTFAAHLIGYDMALVNIKNTDGSATSQYKFKLQYYRDVTGPGMPGSITFTIVSKANNSTVQTITLTKVNPQTYLTFDNENCPPAQAQLRNEFGVYESPAFFGSNFNNSLGYYMYSLHYSRNNGIKNVLGESSGYTLLMTMDFPSLISGPTFQNSSPVFNKKFQTFYMLGKSQTINMQVVDVDGDSLVFSMVKPLESGTTQPFNEIPFAAGYNLNYNIIDGAPDININPSTGIVNFTPTQIGKYLISIKVEEYRLVNGLPKKIGEVRREMQIEIVYAPETPPEIEQSIDLAAIHLVDTVQFPDDFSVIFTARDHPSDSLFMQILPNLEPGENLLDMNTFEGKWGEIGFQTGGADAQNLVIDGMGTVQGQFNWNPRCNAVRDKPYTFKVVVRDKTCPTSFTDTMNVSIYVVKKTNHPPIFVSPDTIRDNTYIRRFYATVGDVVSFSTDSIIKTYDMDSSQSVQIIMIPDSSNGFINSIIGFNATPGLINSTAMFSLNLSCATIRDEPYRIKIIAYDNDCWKPDSIFFTFEIYVKDKIIPNDEICAISIDSTNKYVDVFWNRTVSDDVKFHSFYAFNYLKNEYEFIVSIPNNGTQKLRIPFFGFQYKPIKLKMANINECGSRTPFSAVHSAVYLNYTSDSANNARLTWNAYEGAAIQSYRILRSADNVVFTLLATVSDTLHEFTLTSTDSAYYKIEVQRNDSCYEASPTSNQFSVYSNTVSSFKTGFSIEKQLNVILYPNPSSTFVNIVSNTSSSAEYILMDLNGKILQRGTFIGQTKVDLQNLANGMYIVRINSEGGSVGYKLRIE